MIRYFYLLPLATKWKNRVLASPSFNHNWHDCCPLSISSLLSSLVTTFLHPCLASLSLSEMGFWSSMSSIYLIFVKASVFFLLPSSHMFFLRLIRCPRNCAILVAKRCEVAPWPHYIVHHLIISSRKLLS